MGLNDNQEQNKEEHATEEKEESKDKERTSAATFHRHMATVFDLAYAFLVEKRNHSFIQELSPENSSITIIRLSQSLSCFTDPSNWSESSTRYQAYCISSLRRQLVFGLFRNYDFSIKCLNDLVLISEHTGMPGLVVILEEISQLFADASLIET